jgi:uncharacterized membrane protein
MDMKKLTWIGSLALVFFFLPSLAFKIWNFMVFAPWQVKRWLFYLIIAIVMITFIRWRLRRKKNLPEMGGAQLQNEEVKPMLIAKERLAKGEISLEEFREIRQELKEV